MDRAAAALAGLMHDIGKFWQRAESAPGQRLAPGYEAFTRDDYGTNGAHTTWSVAYAHQFVHKSLRQGLSGILYHHRPQDPGSRLLALADRLASGERVDSGEQQPQRLLSIFTQLGDNLTEDAYLPLRPLELARESLFPQSGAGSTPLPARSDYATLWHQFSRNSAPLAQIEDAVTLVASFYHLMARYTWSIPAAYYRSIPDISLFDHSRVTAAIASCLTEMEDGRLSNLLERSNRRAPDASTAVAYLVEGDISGVQRFIYTITARGATSALRGRSFYLQLLTEAAARFILRRFDLTIANLIYAGGGHFYILVPPSARAELEDIQESFDRLFLDKHEGELYLALGSAQLTCADFQQNHFAGKWREAGEAVSARKRRRFASQGSTLFAVRGQGGDESAECQVCHHEGSDVTNVARDVDDPTPVRKCGLCRSLEELGRNLRNADALLLCDTGSAPEPLPERSWQAVLGQLGAASALRQADGNWRPRNLPNAAVRAELLGLERFPSQEDAAGLAGILACPLSTGMRMTVNVAPAKADGALATFEDLQESSQGMQRLGVLRMDVDDLGHLFTHGFSRQDRSQGTYNGATLSRTASLSSSLARYFEGWVGKLCREVNEEQDSGVVYSIYSGGDDLFVVGAWSELPALAQRISHDFAAYASHNPLLHISGALTLHGGKEPLYQAADSAGEALNYAKEMPGKDTFSFFGMRTKWSQFETVRHLQHELDQIMQQTGGSRSHLHVLLDMYAQYLKAQQEYHLQGRTERGQVIWGPYMWRTLYLLHRMADRYRPAQGSIINFIETLKEAQFSNMRQVALAARWLEALSRKGQIG